MQKPKINFDVINAAALSCLPSLLRQWLPEGKLSGHEYVSKNPTRDDGHPGSFSINIDTGVWKDFATQDGGGSDPVSLFAYLFHNNNQGAAAKELSHNLGVSATTKPQITKPKKPKSEWVAILPPLDTPEPPKAHFIRGLPESTWPYKNLDGQIIGYVYRFKKTDGTKDVIPLTWCKNLQTGKEEWHWKGFEQPRYLYGLDRLANNPDAMVLIVEGEKCADAAQEHLPDFACLTWPGGCNAINKVDWQALAGRRVIIWPDCDAQKDKLGVLLPESKQPGVMATKEIAQKLLSLGCKVWMLNIPRPGEKKHGWDIVDAIEEGLTGDFLRNHLQENSRRVAISESKPIQEVTPAPRPREKLEKLIDKTESFDELTNELVMRVANAGLDKPSIESLLSKIAKKASVPKASLQAVIKSFSANDPHDSIDGDGRIDELNLKHAVIPIGGRVLILNNDFDPVMSRNLLTFSSRNDLETRYCNRKVFFKGEEVGLGTYWLHHARRREYEGMVFSPGQDQPGYLNLWAGWGVEPKEGSCKKYLEFVKDIICAGNDELFDYIIYWCAHLVQRPQELPETALVFRGIEGAGKDTFVSALKAMVGSEHYLMLSSLNQITGRFSGHLANALLVFCNESVWGGDKSAQGVLKSMITDDTQPIEFKGRDLIMVKSYRRMIFATNENWAVPRGAEDRRYIIADVSDEAKGEYDYFKAIRDELRNGGTAALMAYLLKKPIDGWHPRNIPKKLQEQGWELKIRSGDSIIRWWFDMLQQAYFDKTEAYSKEVEGKMVDLPEVLSWPSRCPMEDIQKLYLTWCLNYRILHPEHSVVIGRSVKEFGFRTSRPTKDNPNRKLFYKIPPIEEARNIFSKKFSIPDSVWAVHEDGNAFL